MADKIKLVTNDNLPWITLTITDSTTGLPIDLSAGTTTVSVYFRPQGDTTSTPKTLATTKVSGGSTGQVKFNFPTTTLNVAPGPYEGEVELNFNGDKQTLYELLKFQVRAQLA